MGVLSKLSVLAIGFTEARLYAPQPMAPAQYAGGYTPYAAPAYEAQPMYVSVPDGAIPVAETSGSGTSFLSGVAFVAGLAVTVGTLAHHVEKKATKHHHHSRPRKSRPSDINRKAPQYPPLPDIPWMTKIEKTDEAPVPVAALAVAGNELMKEMQNWQPAVARPWAPMT